MPLFNFHVLKMRAEDVKIYGIQYNTGLYLKRLKGYCSERRSRGTPSVNKGLNNQVDLS